MFTYLAKIILTRPCFRYRVSTIYLDKGKPMNQNEALEIARKAMQKFVTKVECGRAHSVETYGEMKIALDAITEATAPKDTNTDSPYKTASIVAIWLRSALECKEFLWDGDQHEAATHSLEAFEQLIYGDIPARATMQEEIYRLHRELAAATLDAKLGWERAKMHFKALNQILEAKAPGNLCDSDT